MQNDTTFPEGIDTLVQKGQQFNGNIIYFFSIVKPFFVICDDNFSFQNGPNTPSHKKHNVRGYIIWAILSLRGQLSGS